MVRVDEKTPKRITVTFDKSERAAAGSEIFGLIVTGWRTIRGHIRMTDKGTFAYGIYHMQERKEVVTLLPQEPAQ